MDNKKKKKKRRGYGLITWEEVMSQLRIVSDELTRVGIELLGQLITAGFQTISWAKKRLSKDVNFGNGPSILGK